MHANNVKHSKIQIHRFMQSNHTHILYYQKLDNDLTSPKKKLSDARIFPHFESKDETMKNKRRVRNKRKDRRIPIEYE